MHSPSMHVPEHGSLHAPQWSRLVLMFTSQPLLRPPSQSLKPFAQTATSQRPLMQNSLAAFGRLHAKSPFTMGLVQSPQLSTSFRTLISQPSERTPLQSLKPSSQTEMPHSPFGRQRALELLTSQDLQDSVAQPN